MRRMRYAAYGAIALGLIAGAIVGVGALLPVQHRVMRERTVGASPTAVFNLITDIARYPSWRSGVACVDILPPTDGRMTFRETGRDGTIPYVVVSSETDRRVVTQIIGHDLPFGGTWTFELIPADGGTRLRITEDGDVYNPLYRFVSRFIIGQTATIDRYLDDVGKTLGHAPSASPRVSRDVQRGLLHTFSIEQQVQNDDEQDQAQTTAAVVPDAGAHVVAAAAKDQEKNDEDDQQHDLMPRSGGEKRDSPDRKGSRAVWCASHK